MPRHGWAPGEFWKRVAVFAALIIFLAIPMWAWPGYCDAVLWTFLTGGALEWWASAYNSGNATPGTHHG